MGKKKPRYSTFRLMDRTGCIQHPLIVVGKSFEAYRVIYQERHQFRDVLADGTTLLAHIAENEEAARKADLIYYKQPAAPELLAAIIERYRQIALQGEATPEAIRLLDEMSEFTTKERKNMAEKLQAKASAAKPDKEGLKAGAKAAPVAKGTASKPKGNADGLAKARAAKGPAPNRKYKGLVKAKDLKLRGWTLRMAQIALNNTTTEAATAELRADKEFGKTPKRIDFGWLANKGIISKPA